MMNGHSRFRRAIAALLVASSVAGSLGAAWPPEKFTNLKALPADIPNQELVDMMADFTRALGVRCTYCHVGEEGRRLSEYDYASDDKAAKRKAREMIRMVNDLNDRYLANLADRAKPPVRVECATCHRGTTTPRMIEDVLLHEYETAGIDSALATYHGLRDQYYGRAAYDFGSVPLTDVAAKLQARGRDDDALRLLALNVEKNPSSVFAKRQHAALAVSQAYRTEGAAGGVRTYRELHERYGAEAFPEFALNQLGYRLLGEGRSDLAVAVFRLNAEAFPKSTNAFDSLGEALAKHGDRNGAIESYEQALRIDPENRNAQDQLRALRRARK